MPKPLLLVRPSGLYVRFLVPQDLRATVGSRFLLRSLGSERGDRARFVAACLAVALSEAFARMRAGAGMIDIKKVIESAQRAAESGGIREWTASGVRVGGVDFGTVSMSGPQDTLDFIKTMRAAATLRPGPGSARVPQSSKSAEPPGPLLSDEIAHHVADLERRKLAPDTITESKHSLRILLGVVGDRPVAEIKREQLRAFWDAIRWWPANATVKPRYRGLSIPEIVAQGRVDQVPAPSDHTLNKHAQRLGVFFNALVDADVITKSPLRGIGKEIDRSTELDTGRPFTDAELAQIFDPVNFVPWASKYPHRWWGPILGLYTGARVNEVAQLYIDDVREVDGVWGVFFWKHHRAQKIKTKSSIRFVPLGKV